MIDLSYSTFGLTNLPFLDAIAAVAKAGYAGVELSFHRRQFNPYNLTAAGLDDVRRQLERSRIAPACLATASHFFNPQRPHEPSLMTLERAGRERRIDLIKRGIRIARHLGVNLVTFGSGFRRDDHVRNSWIEPREILIDSIRLCLQELRDSDDITLLIEPEPGMVIETLDDGLALLDAVDDERFALHIDICHAYCSDTDYIAALGRAAPRARYLHISDARAGWNLKVREYHRGMSFDLDFAATLVYFPQSADFLLVDRQHPHYFHTRTPTAAMLGQAKDLLAHAGVHQLPRLIDYGQLHAGASRFDDEIFTWLISMPDLSFDVLERAWPIVAFMRGAHGTALIDSMVANTRTGIVHFHEIPGEGTLDIAASFKALNDHGFNGHGSVELYHHVASWQQALEDSYRHLAAIPQQAAP